MTIETVASKWPQKRNPIFQIEQIKKKYSPYRPEPVFAPPITKTELVKAIIRMSVYHSYKIAIVENLVYDNLTIFQPKILVLVE